MKDTNLNNTGQLPSINQTDRICYDVNALKQMKDDPLSKDKPDNAPILEARNLMRDSPLPDYSFSLASISRPISDTLMPGFVKSSNFSKSQFVSKEIRKDAKFSIINNKPGIRSNISPKLMSPQNHIKVSLREDVKLNQSENAWTLSRFKKENLPQEEKETQELYKKFRGILNKLTPEKFDRLMERIKDLKIDTQERLEGVIDLVFEKAIYEPKYSKAYAVMCNRLSTLKVPTKNATTPEHIVYFRAILIRRCQSQFETINVDEKIVKLENEISECSDPAKRKELQTLLDEENRKIRMRAVGNVRFIGELYKLNMLTARIMMFCMQYLLDKDDEEKLECLCKLLTTIGEQVEGEVKEQLDVTFKKMQEIVDKKKNISSRVRFMIEDVIALRQRRWYVKSVVDLQPKTMDQIQREAEMQQRHIEIMNATPMRRETGGGGGGGGGGGSSGGGARSRKGERRPMPHEPHRISYSVDTSKLKAVTNKSLSNIKLAPQNSGWMRGAGLRSPFSMRPMASSTATPTFTNMYSLLADSDAETPPPLPSSNDSVRSCSNEKVRSRSGSRVKSISPVLIDQKTDSISPVRTPEPVNKTEEIEPKEISKTLEVNYDDPFDKKQNRLKTIIDKHIFLNLAIEDVARQIKQMFPPEQHAALITEIVNIILEKSSKEIKMMAKLLLYLVSSETVSEENLEAGLKDILEFAPDLYIDIPMLYDYFAILITPLIENKKFCLKNLCHMSTTVVSSNHGRLLLKAVLKLLMSNVGEDFTLNEWRNSGLNFSQWMDEKQVTSFVEENGLKFLLETVPNEDFKDDNSNQTENHDYNKSVPVQVEITKPTNNDNSNEIENNCYIQIENLNVHQTESDDSNQIDNNSDVIDKSNLNKTKSVELNSIENEDSIQTKVDSSNYIENNCLIQIDKTNVKQMAGDNSNEMENNSNEIRDDNSNEVDIENRILASINAGENCEQISKWLKNHNRISTTQDSSISLALVQALCRHSLSLDSEDTEELFDEKKLYEYLDLLREPTSERLQQELDYVIGVQELMLKIPAKQDALLSIIEFLHHERIISMDALIAYEKFVKSQEQND